MNKQQQQGSIFQSMMCTAAAESWLQFIGRHRRTDIPF
jgi:hypothetical protein